MKLTVKNKINLIHAVLAPTVQFHENVLEVTTMTKKTVSHSKEGKHFLPGR